MSPTAKATLPLTSRTMVFDQTGWNWALPVLRYSRKVVLSGEEP